MPKRKSTPNEPPADDSRGLVRLPLTGDLEYESQPELTGVTLTEAVPREHPVALYLAGLRPRSRATMLRALSRAVRVWNADATPLTWDWFATKHTHLAGLRSQLTTTCAPSYANLILSAVRGVLRAGALVREREAPHLEHVARTAKSVRGSRLPPGRHIPASEVRALCDECLRTPSPVARRTHAAIALMYFAGLRCVECCTLTMDSYDRDEGALRVRGKGDVERFVPLHDEALTAVERWLTVRRLEPGPLLAPTQPRVVLVGQELDSHTLRCDVYRLARKLGIGPLKTHDFRRSFVSNLLPLVDLVTVQRLCGHASPTTTAKYDRRAHDAMRDAIRKLPSLTTGDDDE